MLFIHFKSHWDVDITNIFLLFLFTLLRIVYNVFCWYFSLSPVLAKSSLPFNFMFFLSRRIETATYTNGEREGGRREREREHKRHGKQIVLAYHEVCLIYPVSFHWRKLIFLSQRSCQFQQQFYWWWWCSGSLGCLECVCILNLSWLIIISVNNYIVTLRRINLKE